MNRALVVLAVGLLAPVPAQAVGIGVDLSGVLIEPQDVGFRSTVGDGSAALFEARVMGRVWSGLVIEGGYSYGDISGSLRGGSPTHLELHGAILGVRWQQRLASWIDVYGRLDGVVRWGGFTVKDSVVNVASDAWCGGAEVAGGIELHLPATVFFDAPDESQQDLSVGVTVDAGYAWLSDLVLEGATPGGVTDLGGMSLSTAVVRVGVVLWF